ncbi:hypothetical protein [Sulfurisphaera tokodaii]|uniref:SWIM-type domain-containing protein n=1 Tax=Sulfurisphaera tokodaii TaxID=111955 RepID=A0A832T027_9CREN|nr:hypothetical protein [Sulfurisphaera tokodaii]HII72852.1 hypothetical protein [Sulfurisphaera tokodaii]
MDIKIIKAEKKGDFEEIEGLVPARCTLGYYHVKVTVKGFRLIDSSCECGEKLCPHAVKLEMAFFRKRKELSS